MALEVEKGMINQIMKNNFKNNKDDSLEIKKMMINQMIKNHLADNNLEAEYDIHSHECADLMISIHGVEGTFNLFRQALAQHVAKSVSGHLSKGV